MRGLGRMFFYLTNGASGLWSLNLLKNTKNLPAYPSIPQKYNSGASSQTASSFLP